MIDQNREEKIMSQDIFVATGLYGFSERNSLHEH
jgi:hypothetical protein